MDNVSRRQIIQSLMGAGTLQGCRDDTRAAPESCLGGRAGEVFEIMPACETRPADTSHFTHAGPSCSRYVGAEEDEAFAALSAVYLLVVATAYSADQALIWICMQRDAVTVEMAGWLAYRTETDEKVTLSCQEERSNGKCT